MRISNKFYKHGILILLYITAFFDVCFEQPVAVRGLLLILFVALVFFDDFVYSLPMIVVLNDGLGTAIVGSLSFYWVAVVLIIFRIIIKQEKILSAKAAVFVTLGLLYSFFLFAIQFENNLRTPMMVLAYFIIISYIIEQIDVGKASFYNIMATFACSVGISAAQMTFFGGVDYTTFGYTNDYGEYTRTERYGLIGTGSGDPNFSGLTLLFGMICLWSSNIKKIIKILISGIFLYSIVKTVSITALLVLVLLLLFVIFIQYGKKKRVKTILGVMFAIALIYILTVLFPIGSIAEQISLYYFRIQSKLNFFMTGNIGELTTNRSTSASANIEYAFSRNFFQMIFGFEKIPAPRTEFAHNTYVDILIHFGVLGLCAYIILILKQFFTTLKDFYINKTKKSQAILALKLLWIVFSFSLSIYTGHFVALLSWILLIL